MHFKTVEFVEPRIKRQMTKQVCLYRSAVIPGDLHGAN